MSCRGVPSRVLPLDYLSYCTAVNARAVEVKAPFVEGTVVGSGSPAVCLSRSGTLSGIRRGSHSHTAGLRRGTG